MAQQNADPADVSHHLLVISDLHLGHDLKADKAPKLAHPVDAPLAEWLDHMSEHTEGGKPWRLLINGDAFDFVSMTCTPAPDDMVPFTVTSEERQFGLAPEEAKCVWKVRRIAERHRLVFDALARFVARGHQLAWIRGNHDVELAWPAVRQTLVQVLAERADLANESESENEYEARERFCSRINFFEWFYWEPGRVYVEHGNLYDPFCRSDWLAPTERGEGELGLPVSSQVIRYFANRHAPQDDIEQAERWGVVEYVRWLLERPAPFRVLFDYLVMLGRILLEALRGEWLLRSRRISSAQSWVRDLIEAWSPGESTKAERLLGLLARPAGASLLLVARLFYLERFLVGALSVATLAWALSHSGTSRWIGVALSVLGLLLMSGLGRLRQVEAHPMLLRAAPRLLELFSVPLLVMGHSHRPLDLRLDVGRYINLGSWTHGIERGYPHLVVTGAGAELRHWSKPPSEPETPTPTKPTITDHQPPTLPAPPSSMGEPLVQARSAC
jgi:UDP-2,3-diacylglucosamine pyrophosphatase LpxH